eukprot:364560-Chlamydomonas_euryale.AAC.2
MHTSFSLATCNPRIGVEGLATCKPTSRCCLAHASSTPECRRLLATSALAAALRVQHLHLVFADCLQLQSMLLPMDATLEDATAAATVGSLLAASSAAAADGGGGGMLATGTASQDLQRLAAMYRNGQDVRVAPIQHPLFIQLLITGEARKRDPERGSVTWTAEA